MRDDALRMAADLLEQESAALLEANRGDLARAESGGMAASAQDRLRLTEERIRAMAAGLRGVATLADPVGEVLDGWVRPNGLRVSRVRVPLGVVGVIYENRPNVTSDAAGLCLKAGNAAFLRGSASALASNQAIVSILRRAAEKAGLPADAVALVEDTSHETAVAFMRLRGLIDCLIPRGGPALIASLLEHATVPVRARRRRQLPRLHRCGGRSLHGARHRGERQDAPVRRVQRGRDDPGARRRGGHVPAGHGVGPGGRRRGAAGRRAGAGRGARRRRGRAENDFATEFLGPIVAVGVVDDLDGAIEHITRYSSGHSEAIVTTDVRAADRFVAEVDAAAVLVNASTRFIDGEELGLGAEVGISTQKLHARGPMGVRELTSVKWVVRGDGQVRQ